jgi:hypothetical protein
VRLVHLFVAVILGAAAAFPGQASGMEGGPPFWFDAQFMGPPASDGTLRVGLDMGGLYDTSTVAEAHLVIPPGLECVSGDTLVRFKIATDDRVRTLLVRARANGTHVIRGYLTVDQPRRSRRDEAELELSVIVAGDSIQQQPGRAVRQVSIRGTQRFRFGGEFMVPIDQSEESVTQDEILTRGERPRVLRKTTATCAGCAASTPTTVPWVVFLDPKGGVRDARPLAVTARDSVAVAASREALKSWRFYPASLGGRSVSDCIVVQVPIDRTRQD